MLIGVLTGYWPCPLRGTDRVLTLYSLGYWHYAPRGTDRVLTLSSQVYWQGTHPVLTGVLTLCSEGYWQGTDLVLAGVLTGYWSCPLRSTDRYWPCTHTLLNLYLQEYWPCTYRGTDRVLLTEYWPCTRRDTDLVFAWVLTLYSHGYCRERDLTWSSSWRDNMEWIFSRSLRAASSFRFWAAGQIIQFTRYKFINLEGKRKTFKTRDCAQESRIVDDAANVLVKFCGRTKMQVHFFKLGSVPETHINK